MKECMLNQMPFKPGLVEESPFSHHMWENQILGGFFVRVFYMYVISFTQTCCLKTAR